MKKTTHIPFGTITITDTARRLIDESLVAKRISSGRLVSTRARPLIASFNSVLVDSSSDPLKDFEDISFAVIGDAAVLCNALLFVPSGSKLKLRRRFPLSDLVEG